MKNRNVVIPSPLLISAAVSSFYFIGGFALPRYSPSSGKKTSFHNITSSAEENARALDPLSRLSRIRVREIPKHSPDVHTTALERQCVCYPVIDTQEFLINSYLHVALICIIMRLQIPAHFARMKALTNSLRVARLSREERLE